MYSPSTVKYEKHSGRPPKRYFLPVIKGGFAHSVDGKTVYEIRRDGWRRVGK